MVKWKRNGKTFSDRILAEKQQNTSFVLLQKATSKMKAALFSVDKEN